MLSWRHVQSRLMRGTVEAWRYSLAPKLDNSPRTLRRAAWLNLGASLFAKSCASFLVGFLLPVCTYQYGIRGKTHRTMAVISSGYHRYVDALGHITAISKKQWGGSLLLLGSDPLGYSHLRQRQ